MIDKILEAVVKHQDEHPSHGYDCSCMDPFVRLLRQDIKKIVPGPVYDGTPEDDALKVKNWRVRHVILTVLKSVP